MKRIALAELEESLFRWPKIRTMLGFSGDKEKAAAEKEEKEKRQEAGRGI